MIGYVRAGLVLIVLGFTAWGGWYTRSLLEDRHALAKANQERDAAIARERAAEATAQEVEQARVDIATALDAERTKIHDQVKTVIKRVPTYINGADCALDVDGVRDLNTVRGAAVPDAGRLADDGPHESRPDTP